MAPGAMYGFDPSSARWRALRAANSSADMSVEEGAAVGVDAVAALASYSGVLRQPMLVAHVHMGPLQSDLRLCPQTEVVL